MFALGAGNVAKVRLVTAFERLSAIASGQGEVWEKARRMIGEGELALLLVKAALDGTSMNLSPTKVGEVLNIQPRSARDKIDNCAVKAGGMQ